MIYIVITYLVVLLGSLRLAVLWHRSDSEIDARADRKTANRIWYVLPAFGWPVLWLLMPLAMLVSGILVFSEEL